MLVINRMFIIGISCISSSDIVFFIFLYQRWIYKVDSKRINEFGFSAEMLEEQQAKAIQTNALTDSGSDPNAAGDSIPVAAAVSSGTSSDESKSQPSSPNAGAKRRKNKKSSPKANTSSTTGKKDD